MAAIRVGEAVLVYPFVRRWEPASQLPANAMVKPDAPLERQPQLAGDGSRVLVKAEALARYFSLANGY